MELQQFLFLKLLVRIILYERMEVDLVSIFHITALLLLSQLL